MISVPKDNVTCGRCTKTLVSDHDLAVSAAAAVLSSLGKRLPSNNKKVLTPAVANKVGLGQHEDSNLF